MTPDDLSTRLRATFIQELEDQLRTMDACLLILEGRPDDAESIRTIFRAAHSVKGAARVAGVPLVEEACHAIETLFTQVRNGDRTLDGADFALLFAAADALRDAGVRLRGGDDASGGMLEALLPRISAAAGTTADSAADDAVPAAGTPHSPAAIRDGNDVPARVSAAPEAAAAARAPADAPESVRVSAASLDALASHAADLLTTASAIAQAPATLEDLRTALSRWAQGWRRQSRDLKDAQQQQAHAELDRQLHQISERAARIAQAGQDEARGLMRATGDILNGVRGLRMRRFADAVEALPRAARDVAAATGKSVQLVIEGEDVEADRLVIDALREPLLHLVRNAVDHGIETPDQRRAAGKPAQGRVRVVAALEQGRLRIVVEDDGRGIAVAAVRERLAEAGEDVPPDTRGLARRLLAGGITTKREATNISGRGVGLDVVRASIERIGGSVELRWRPGELTRFVLDSPPSPATLRAIIADAGGQLFALPIGQVAQVVRVDAARVREVEGRAALMLGDAPVPLATLAGILGPPLRERPSLLGAQALVLHSGSDTIAIVVDAVDDEREVVVRPLDRHAHVPHVSGGALLPSGRVALVLVARTLTEAGLDREIALPAFASATDAAPARHLLVVDDSITTRTLEQSVLEAAGYRVTAAVDGQDAWEKLQQAGVDLVVSDLEMPRMSGFELCRRMRDSKRFAELPVVLVTGLESAEDRALGLEVGADAYLAKSSFDQSTLLDTIRQLIG